jgi:archaellum biogenesis protein FlaJ (TadC family)
MEDNTVLLPLNYSNNWILINHANYMAGEKNIINLDNYEGTKPHFPLIWKRGEQVYDLMSGFGNRMPPCINIENYETQTHHRIDYLSRFCYTGDSGDSCNSNVEKEIKEKFEQIYQSGNNKLQLYKRRPGT